MRGSALRAARVRAQAVGHRRNGCLDTRMHERSSAVVQVEHSEHRGVIASLLSLVHAADESAARKEGDQTLNCIHGFVFRTL
jgi:hypothetical protein